MICRLHHFFLVMTLGLVAGVCSGQDAANGAALYVTHCVACHQPEGEGAAGIAPPLAGTLSNRAALQDGLAYIARVMISGMNGPIVVQGQPYNGNMPSFAALGDMDLQAILSFVLERFNAGSPAPSLEMLAAVRVKAMLPGDVRKLRQQLIARVGEQ